MKNTKKIKNALISVSNTLDIINFSKSLVAKNVKLFATSGTANLLKENKIDVTEISEYTQYPEIMNGRIKTLHHKIYASILARPQDKEIIKNSNITVMDMIIVNFYSFTDTVLNNNNLTLNDAIEYIDIGGPTMVRAAAKNHKNILVIVQPQSYQVILEEMNLNNNKISYETKLHFAIVAFKYTMNYDKNIYKYLYKHHFKSSKKINNHLPSDLTLHFKKKQDLRYGENEQQQAAWYTNSSKEFFEKTNIMQIQGKVLSYNNLSDIHSSLSYIQEFEKFTCTIIKHGNACGIATSKNNNDAYLLAYKTDPISAFGGIISFNTILHSTTAKKIIETQFSEIILAPDFTEKAKKIFQKKSNLRIIKYNENYNYSNYEIDIKSIHGDILIQTNPKNVINQKKWKIVSKKYPTMREIHDAKFGLRVVKHLKSNAVVFIKNKTTISIGAGQTSRIDAIKIAINKTYNNNISLHNTILASDAFLPFQDSINLISSHGITCIIQPGGSIRDDEVIASANKNNISMIFTKTRYFKH